MARDDFKPKKQGKGSSLISSATLKKLLEQSQKPEVVLDSTQFVKEQRAKSVHYRLRQSVLSAARGGGGSFALPFAARYNATTGEISVAAGYWQEGKRGPWTAIPATAATEGTHVYLVITQDEECAVVSPDPEIIIRDEAFEEELLLSEEAPYHVIEARVLLAEVIDGRLIQRQHGNFTLGVIQESGSVTRWPETVVGSVPPPPAP